MRLTEDGENMKVKCYTLQHQLSDYIDDTLSERQKAVVAAHLRACPLCQNELAALKKTRELVGRFYVTPTAPDAYYARFAARLQERIEQRGTGTFPQRIRATVKIIIARFGWQLQTHLLRCLPVGRNFRHAPCKQGLSMITPRVVVLSVLLLAMSTLGVVTFRHVLDVPQENASKNKPRVQILTPRGTLPIGEKRVESVGTHAVRPPASVNPARVAHAIGNAPAPLVTPKPLGSKQLSATPVPMRKARKAAQATPDTNVTNVVNSLSGTPMDTFDGRVVTELPTRGMLLTDTDYALLLVQGIAGTKGVIDEGHQPYEPKRPRRLGEPPTGFAPLLLDVPLETRTIREVYDSIKL